MRLDRRSFLAVLGAGAMAPSCTQAPAPAPAPVGPPRADAFGLIGDRYHNSDYIRSGLNRTIAKPLGVSIDFCDDTHQLNAATLQGRKLLIILRDGMIWPDGYPNETTNAAWVATGKPELKSDPPVDVGNPKPAFWIQPGQGKAVHDFVEAGGSALLLHNVTHVGLTDPDFRAVLKAAYAGHPRSAFKVKVTNPDHPITKGVKDFIVTDEQHYMEYDGDRGDIFLETVNEEGLDYDGKGRWRPAVGPTSTARAASATCRRDTCCTCCGTPST